jgi:hypothetical protein
MSRKIGITIGAISIPFSAFSSPPESLENELYSLIEEGMPPSEGLFVAERATNPPPNTVSNKHASAIFRNFIDVLNDSPAAVPSYRDAALVANGKTGLKSASVHPCHEILTVPVIPWLKSTVVVTTAIFTVVRAIKPLAAFPCLPFRKNLDLCRPFP